MPRSVLTPHALAAFPRELAGGVVAIGNFDGVHRGHAALIGAAVTEARRLNVPAVALTFEPHPRTFFRPDPPVFRLTPLSAKARLLAALGIDYLAVATFDAAFAGLTPDAFARDDLAGRLRAAAAVVGPGFRYGKGRAGTVESLAEEGARLGFTVKVIGAVAGEDGKTISSSVIREALAAGEVGEANRLLGHRWFVIGSVIPGDRRGHELGFPTANIRLDPDCRLRHGIYAVSVGRKGQTMGGVASFGRRPTFDNGAPLLEVFLFDFSGDLYGESLTVTFLDWIRPELRFDSAAALIAAMHGDVQAARALVASAPPGTGLDGRLHYLAADEIVPSRPFS
jgi:riboflavin kinase/FMN adenylyltransferase